jgi:hypothetical protein
LSIHESVVADAAVTAPGGVRSCDESDERVEVTKGQYGLGYNMHCPSCQLSGGQDCPHLLANWNSETNSDGSLNSGVRI